MHTPEVIKKVPSLFDEKKVRNWAYGNAYTLIFLATFFVITWAIIVVSNFAIR